MCKIQEMLYTEQEILDTIVRKGKMNNLLFNMNKIFTKIEEDLTIIVVIPVPGLTKEDVGVTIVEGNIVVSISKSNEFVSKDITRTIPLPKKASTNDVQSIVKDGILTIKFKKKQEYLPTHLVVE